MVKNIYDKAADCVITLGRSKEKSSQLNALLEVLSSESDSTKAIRNLQVWLLYQSSTREILSKDFARCTYDVLEEIFRTEPSNDIKMRRVREFLTIIKRLYKAVEDVQNIDQVQKGDGSFDRLAKKVLEYSQNPSNERGRR